MFDFDLQPSLTNPVVYCPHKLLRQQLTTLIICLSPTGFGCKPHCVLMHGGYYHKQIPCNKEFQLIIVKIRRILTPKSCVVLYGPSLIMTSLYQQSTAFDPTIQSHQLLVT